MEEKVIIKSEVFDFTSIRNRLWLIGIIPVLILALLTFGFWSDYSTFKAEYYNSPYVSYAAIANKEGVFLAFLIITIICLLLDILGGLFIAHCFSKTAITVTDKRTYGTTAFGKRVDLPNDSISAIGICMFKGIAVATSSGKIKFLWIKNRDEIQKVISSILIERQGKGTTTIKQEIPQSNADELRKFKELLDSGIISQEEFEAKKKQLLGV